MIDLSQPYGADMPAVEPHGRPNFTPVRHALSGTPFSISRISMSAHTGTHVDAPRHLLPEGKTLDAYPPDRFTGSAVVIDVRREGAVPITAADLAAATPSVETGDIVLLCSGYAERFGSEEYRRTHPYLADGAAQFLVDRSVRMVGLDLQTPDKPASERGTHFGFPAHRILLEAECLIVENLGPALARLVGRRVGFSAIPLLIPGADGGPVRAVAWEVPA